MINTKRRKKTILGLPIHDITMKELLIIINDTIIGKDKKIIYGYSGGIYPRLKDMPEFVDYYNHCDIVVSDGAGLPLIAKLFGISLIERIGLPNLVYKVLELANDKKYSIYLLGAKEEVNKEAIKNIEEKYSNITCCYGHHGYYKIDEEENILNDINEVSPDILLIGMSSPKKEEFAVNNISYLNSKIIIPCGGMIDVIAGKIKRPPPYLSKLPMTWLVRFIQEPRRLYSTSLKLVFQLIFHLLPVMLFKHYIRGEKNPSVMEYYNRKMK